MLGIEENFRCVLEEDGSEVVNEVLEAFIQDSEKIGVIMVLKQDEEWSPGN